MALTAAATLEKKHTSVWTREQRLQEAIQHMKRTGQALSAADTTDLLAMVTAMDDYLKGTTTAIDAAKTNYNNWLAQPNIR